MSDRMCINGNQLFGNNESPKPWNDFIRSQGLEIDESGHYEGYITDVMGALSAIEQVIFEKEDYLNSLPADGKHTTSCFDHRKQFAQLKARQRWAEKIGDKHDTNLTDVLFEIFNNGYMMLPLYFLYTIREDIKRDRAYADGNHLNCFKIIEGRRIHVRFW